MRVLEKFRTGEYEVHNLSVLDEAASRVLDVGGLRLRLFGLGGAVASHRMCESKSNIIDQALTGHVVDNGLWSCTGDV